MCQSRSPSVSDNFERVSSVRFFTIRFFGARFLAKVPPEGSLLICDRAHECADDVTTCASDEIAFRVELVGHADLLPVVFSWSMLLTIDATRE